MFRYRCITFSNDKYLNLIWLDQQPATLETAFCDLYYYYYNSDCIKKAMTLVQVAHQLDRRHPISDRTSWTLVTRTGNSIWISVRVVRILRNCPKGYSFGSPEREHRGVDILTFGLVSSRRSQIWAERVRNEWGFWKKLKLVRVEKGFVEIMGFVRFYK